MPRQQDFDEIREQAQFAAETGGTVHDADPAVILALFERFDANTTTADEGVEIVADLRTQLAITSAALRAACHDGWADGDSAMASYLLRGAIDADLEDHPATPDDADDDDDALLEHGWRLRQDEPLPDGALEVIESLAAVGADCGAGTAHAAALDDDDQAISTYGVLFGGLLGDRCGGRLRDRHPPVGHPTGGGELMALNGMFVEASSVTDAQQWRTDTSAEWRDGPINLGAMRFQRTQIVEVRDRPIPPEVQAWGPDDRSDAALRSGRWEVSPRSDVAGDTPTQIRFVRPGSEHSYSTLSAKDIVGSHPFEAWRTILAALFRPRPLDADHLLARLADDLEEGGFTAPDLADRKALRAELADADPDEPAEDLAEGLVLAMSSSSRVFAEVRDAWVASLTTTIETHRKGQP